MKSMQADGNEIAAGPEWSVYIVECSDLTLYTGVTNGLERRINEVCFPCPNHGFV